MDTLKNFQSVIKDVLHHIHSTENRTVPSIRMSEILNISQTSENSELKPNNSINTRVHKIMIEKERKKFLDELLFLADHEVALDENNHKPDFKINSSEEHHNTTKQLTHSMEETQNRVYDRYSQLNVDYGEEKHTNVKEMKSYIENECIISKTDDISESSQNHDACHEVTELFEEYKEFEPMQISLESNEKLSEEVMRTFKMLKSRHDVPKNNDSLKISDIEKRHTRSRQTCSLDNHDAEHIENVETDKYPEDVIQNNTNINDQQSYRRSVKAWVDVDHTENDGKEDEVVLRSSGMKIVTPRLKDPENELHESCADHVDLKQIIVEDTTHQVPTTKSSRSKKVPVMGKAALLQKANIDHADYLIIQDLILAKYSNKIRQYLERNRKRRKSRCEHFEEYISSSQCTPSSISSLEYLDGCDQKSGIMFSSSDRDNLEENVINLINSPRYIQNTTHSYSISNGFISRNRHTSYSSISELESRENGFCGNSTKLISQDDEMWIQKSNEMERSKRGECNQCVECSGYERQDSHRIQPDMENANSITCEISDGQNSDKKLSFMKSTDDFNAHSPLNSTTCSTYSVSKFIANALSGVNSAQGQDNNNDTIGSASYQSPNYTSNDDSITTSKISDLLSKGSTLTNGLSRGKRLIRTDSLYDTEIPQNDNLELELLTTELSKQNQILLQASKAVKHCRTKDILHSTGYIEAERILLLTSETKKALNKKIHSMESNKYYNKNQSATLSTAGQIDIKNMVFELDRPDNHNDKNFEVFLVLVKCGREVHGSRVLQSNSSKIQFDRSVTFDDLTSDFRICIEIYSMTVAFQEDHHYNCPTPMDMFHVNRHSKRSSFGNEDSNLNVTSAFTLTGSCDIRISDLTKTDGTGKLLLKLQNISKDCIIANKIFLTIQSKLKLNSCLRGFLTIGTENEHCCIIWNRRWCMLKGSTLVYWNHPSEEEFTPNGSITLTDCTENYIALAERHLCSRPRTLMLPIVKGEDLKRYFLSTDDNIELDTWGKHLNLTIRALKVWRNSEIC